jgi:hypothetical protein
MKKTRDTISLSAPKRNIIFWTLIVGIFIWGLALRAVEVINGNYLFGLDQGRDYLAASNIIVNHKLTLIGAEAGSGVAGINGIFHGPGYFYLISLAYLLFHGDPIGGEVFMLLFGIAALVLSAWVGYKMLGRLGSVLFLFFTAVSPLIVSQSRFIWSSHPITVFVILALYFVYRIPNNPTLFAPLAVFVAGFSYNSQLGVSVPLTVSILVSIPIVFRIRDWKVYLYSLFALGLAFLPMILFDIRHGFTDVRSALAYLSSGTATNGSMFEAKRLSSHAFDYWNNFYNTFTFEFGWIPWQWQMIILYAAIPFVGLGLFLVRGTKEKRFVWFLLLMIVLTWAAYLLLNNVVWDYYLTHTRIAYILLFTFAGVALWRAKKNLFAAAGLAVGVVFLCTIVCGTVFRQYISYTLDIRDLGVYDKIIGKRLVIDTIYHDAQGQPFSVFVFLPGVYTYPYDYLFQTYGAMRYGSVPTHEKKGLAYLIIEPDKSQPWRQNGWLQTVVQGGSSIWIKTLLNGLILEKRIY